MALIDHHDLEELAKRSDAKPKFGELVQRLVFATTAERRPRASFLSGEVDNQPGWDGRVEVAGIKDDPRIHRSVWDLSTKEDVSKKVADDWRKASKHPLPADWNPGEVTYVAATLRPITQARMRSLRLKLLSQSPGYWADVVVLGGHNFVEWIRHSCSVEAWIGEELNVGRGRFGRSLDHFWHHWSRQTSRPLTTELVARGRDLSHIVTALRTGDGMDASVVANSPEEAAALVYCAIKSLSTEESNLLLADALVVRDAAAAQNLTVQEVWRDAAPLTLLMPPATQEAQALLNRGHRVIKVLGRSDRRSSVIEVQRSLLDDFRAALVESMGMDCQSAETEARSCGCSVSIWRIYDLYRSNRHQGSVPRWAEGPCPQSVRTAIFLGGWSQDSIQDRTLIEELARMPADDVFKELHPFGICDDPLFEVVGEERVVIAPTAAFALISRHVTGADLHRLQAVCHRLFGTVSEEVARHWRGEPAQIRLRRPREELSDWIRDGLAETLLRIAVLDEGLRDSGALGGYGDGQTFVNAVVRDLPGLRDDPRVMASLGSVDI